MLENDKTSYTALSCLESCSIKKRTIAAVNDIPRPALIANRRANEDYSLQSVKYELLRLLKKLKAVV